MGFSIYKALLSGLFIVALCLHDFHTCLWQREALSVCSNILWDVREVKAAACKLVVCCFCEEYRRLTVSLILQLCNRKE